MKRKYSKSKKYKKKKSILKNRFFWYLILIVFVIVFFYYFFIFSNVFQARKIQILGEEFNTQEEIINIVNLFLEKQNLFFKTKSIFLINKKHIENALLDNFLNIEELKVFKILPNKLSIKIQERIPKIIAQYEDKEYLLDKNGLVFELQEGDYQLPLFIFKESINFNDIVLSSNLIRKIEEIDRRLEPDSFAYQNEDVVANIGQTQFIFDYQKNITQQIEDLLLLLENRDLRIEDLDYVDLRFDKIFYMEN